MEARQALFAEAKTISKFSYLLGVRVCEALNVVMRPAKESLQLSNFPSDLPANNAEALRPICRYWLRWEASDPATAKATCLPVRS